MVNRNFDIWISYITSVFIKRLMKYWNWYLGLQISHVQYGLQKGDHKLGSKREADFTKADTGETKYQDFVLQIEYKGLRSDCQKWQGNRASWGIEFIFKELSSKTDKVHDRAKHKKGGGEGGRNWAEWHQFLIMVIQVLR